MAQSRFLSSIRNLFGSNEGQQSAKFYYPNSSAIYFNLNKWDSYRLNPFVHSAINLRATTCSLAKIKCVDKDGKELEDPLIEKLKSPNRYESFQDFIRNFVTYMSVNGTGYIYNVAPKGFYDRADRVDELVSLFGDDLIFEGIEHTKRNQLQFEKDDSVKIYFDDKTSSKLLRLENNQLLPFFDTATKTNPYYSESRLSSIKEVVESVMVILESRNVLNGNPGGIGILSADAKDGMGANWISNEEKESVEKKLPKKYGTSKGKTPIIYSGVPHKFTSMAQDVSKYKHIESLQSDGLTIFQAFDIPKELFTALLNGSTFENQQMAYERYLSGDPKIIMDNVCQSLTTLFKKEEEGKHYIASFDHLEAMQKAKQRKIGNYKTLAEGLNIALQSGFISQEEAEKEYRKLWS